MMCLKKLLPEQMHNLIRVDAQHQHSISADYKIISISNEIAVPIASASIFRIDFLPETVDGHDISIKWPGTVPTKCKRLSCSTTFHLFLMIFVVEFLVPDLLVKLLKAVDETRFTELVLNRHTKVLLEEWKKYVNILLASLCTLIHFLSFSKVICLNHAKSTNGQNKLKRVLGVQPQDQPLINYWSAHLH